MRLMLAVTPSDDLRAAVQLSTGISQERPSSAFIKNKETKKDVVKWIHGYLRTRSSTPLPPPPPHPLPQLTDWFFRGHLRHADVIYEELWRILAACLLTAATTCYSLKVGVRVGGWVRELTQLS